MPEAVTSQVTVMRRLLGGGMLGMRIPGEVMLATVSAAGIGHNAAPLATEQLIDVHAKPAEGMSLNRALVRFDGPVFVIVIE